VKEENKRIVYIFFFDYLCSPRFFPPVLFVLFLLFGFAVPILLHRFSLILLPPSGKEGSFKTSLKKR
jgi:hypothetical protein